ncbi:MAG TPA: folate-binding protein [Stellaceae bacterium]|nr:folate-binding protein [Stellaceae bacterium]
MPQAHSSLLDPRGVLEIAGEDRHEFLQGLITNDARKLSPSRALYAAFLTPQGKYLHDFFLMEIGGSVLLDGERARLGDLLRRLSIYKLRSKVTLADASERFQVSAAFGDDALALLDLPAERGAARMFAGGVAYVDPRLAQLGARLLLPRSSGMAPLEALGFKRADAEVYDRLRLAAGIPDGSRDLPIEKAILLEAGFDELNGIDWEKGCYMGQELTARTKYRALIKKRLLPVRIDGAPPPPGTPILLGEQEAGEIRSGSGELALALIRLEALEEAASSGAALTAGGSRVIATKPDWARF